MSQHFTPVLREQKRPSAIGTVLRAVFLCICAGGILWACLPLRYGIFHWGNAVLLAAFGLIFLGLVFYRTCGRLIARICAGKGGRIVLVCILVLLAAGLVYASILSVFVMRAPQKQTEERNLPLIVLGCHIIDDSPSPILENRLVAAKEYLIQNPEAPCIVSGGKTPGENYAEAEVMKQWLTANGIDEKRIIVEDRSQNTEENMRFSMEHLQQKGWGSRAVVATDFWHEWRAQLFAQRVGLEAYAYPCSTPLDLLPTYYVRELLALTRYLVLGR